MAWRTFVRTCILAFALVVLLGLVLGATRWMTLGWYLGSELIVAAMATMAAGVFAAGGFAAGLALPVRGTRLAGPATRPPAVAVGFWMAVVAFVIATRFRITCFFRRGGCRRTGCRSSRRPSATRRRRISPGTASCGFCG
jgi:hypothetical protein